MGAFPRAHVAITAAAEPISPPVWHGLGIGQLKQEDKHLPGQGAIRGMASFSIVHPVTATESNHRLPGLTPLSDWASAAAASGFF